MQQSSAEDRRLHARRMKAAQDEVRQIEPLHRVAGRRRIRHGGRLRGGAADPGTAHRRRRGAGRPQDRLHQPGHVGALRRAPADLGRDVRPHRRAPAAGRRRRGMQPGRPRRAEDRARDRVRPALDACRRHRPGGAARLHRVGRARLRDGAVALSRLALRAPDAIADGSLHGLLLLGEPQPVGRARDGAGSGAGELLSRRFPATAARSSTATGAAVLGSPLAALAHLVAVLAGQPQSPPLAAGEIVTTGTITAAYPVRAGETWRSRVEGIGLPGLEVRFTAVSRRHAACRHGGKRRRAVCRDPPDSLIADFQSDIARWNSENGNA